MLKLDTGAVKVQSIGRPLSICQEVGGRVPWLMLGQRAQSLGVRGPAAPHWTPPWVPQGSSTVTQWPVG